MNWMENLLIVAGVSLDIFAAMECQGSLVAKINIKNPLHYAEDERNLYFVVPPQFADTSQ